MPKYLSNIDLNQNQLVKAVVHGYAGNPNTIVTGIAGQLLFDTTNQILYYSKGTTVWEPLVANTDTVTRVRGTAGGTFVSGDITLLAAGATSINQVGNNITISSTDTNTTYSKGNGLTLTGTTFALGTPGTLTEASTNDVSADSHTHAITNHALNGTSNVISVTGSARVLGAAGTLNLIAGHGDTVNPYGSKTANWVLAAPNGSAGLPVFRALVAADLPSHTHTSYVENAGDTMTGFLTLHANPTQALHAVTKQYVDSVSEGLHIHASVAVATTTNIAATYTNGAAGVGATLTIASTTVLDGYTLVNGDRILVKDQTTQFQNGVYVRTSATVWTRADDYNTVTEIQAGDFVFVVNGTQFGASGFVQTRPVSTVGTDIIVWSQFSGASTSYTAGTGIAFAGNIINHSNAITAGNAGPAANATLTFGGTFTVPQIHYDAQGHIITNTATRTFTMPAAPAAPNAGTLALTTPAGASGTGVVVGTGTGFNANSTGAITYTLGVGPSIPALATLMAGGTTGTVIKTGADAFALVPTLRKATSTLTGASTTFNIDHNFGTQDVVVSLRETATNEVVFVDITMPTVNRVTVTFASAPAAASYVVTIIG